MAISWNACDSVGVPSIDEQHSELVQMTNDLFEAIMGDRGEVVVKGILEGLAKYVAYHFSYEEYLLSSHGYPVDDLEQHIEEHRTITTKLYDFMVKCNRNEDTVDLELYDFLREWMVGHLSTTDREYADFLQTKGVK